MFEIISKRIPRIFAQEQFLFLSRSSRLKERNSWSHLDARDWKKDIFVLILKVDIGGGPACCQPFAGLASVIFATKILLAKCATALLHQEIWFCANYICALSGNCTNQPQLHELINSANHGEDKIMQVQTYNAAGYVEKDFACHSALCNFLSLIELILKRNTTYEGGLN